MGKNYWEYNAEKFELPEGKYMADLCAANGTYCLTGCTHKENSSCKRLELKKKEKLK